jgi:hypothetical protein
MYLPTYICEDFSPRYMPVGIQCAHAFVHKAFTHVIFKLIINVANRQVEATGLLLGRYEEDEI